MSNKTLKKRLNPEKTDTSDTQMETILEIPGIVAVKKDVTPHKPVPSSLGVTRSQVDTKVIQALSKKYGAGVIQWLSDVPVMPKVTTGLPNLDEALRGGIEVGGIVTIDGLDQSGKTSLALQIAGRYDGVVYIDGERKLSLETAMRFGAHEDYILVQPDSLEEAFEIARYFLKAGKKLVVVDSLPSLPSLKEVNENDFTKVTGIAPTAGLLSKKLAVLNNICHKMGSTLLIVNQLRENTAMAPFPGAEKYHPFGGRQLRSLRKLHIRCARKNWVKVVVKGEKKEIGQTFIYQVVYSSYGAPRDTGEVPLIFDEGFKVKDDLVDVVYEEVEPDKGYVDGRVSVEEIDVSTSGVGVTEE